MLLLTMQGCFHSSSGGGGGTTNNAPTASSVTITDDNGDTAVVGDTLSGSYTYADAEGDVEGATTFRWLRDGIAIDGATATSYTLVSEDISTQITFEVTPVATTGSATGSAVTSSAVMVANNADPAGYYNNTGTASVEDGAGGTMMINDLQAMVSGDRIMMTSTANGLLYDGTITDISGNRFTADFTIYTDGENPMPATASGTILEESKIEGALSGSGVGKGTFTLTYAQATEQQAADLVRIKDRFWDGDLAVGPDYSFNINAQGLLIHRFAAGLNVSVFDDCEINGTVTPISGLSLYEVTATLTNCVDPNVDTSAINNYTGFAVSRTDSVVDDTLVFALSSEGYSPNGELTVE
jgi:hypothetical protein